MKITIKEALTPKEIKEFDKNILFLKRLILCYSLPNYENIAVFKIFKMRKKKEK